jgi:hypothetical protein
MNRFVIMAEPERITDWPDAADPGVTAAPR